MDDLERMARESYRDFRDRSFVKFARENYPELEVTKITEFGYATGFKAGHAHALSKASGSFEGWVITKLTDEDRQYVEKGDISPYFIPHYKNGRPTAREAWTAARLSVAKELAEKDKEIEILDSYYRANQVTKEHADQVRLIRNKYFSKKD